MPDIEKYVEKIKAQTLYEAREPESLARDILKQWDTNQRVNEKMAKRVISGEQVGTTYRGIFKESMKGLMDGIITMYRGMDGWAITKAIEAEGQRASKEQEEKKSLLDKLGV